MSAKDMLTCSSCKQRWPVMKMGIIKHLYEGLECSTALLGRVRGSWPVVVVAQSGCECR